MPRFVRELTALKAKSIKEPGMYAAGGTPGLYLQVQPGGSKSWILRVTAGTNSSGKQRRREIGLGSFDTVSLAEARESAREQRGIVLQGKDPVAEKKAARRAIRPEVSTGITFESAAGSLIAAKSPEWKSLVHYQQWVSTLTTYAYPFIGSLPIKDVDTRHILSILEPIWIEKTETATRVRSRLEAVLDWATAHEYRQGANPARWKGHLDKMLPSPGKVAKKGRHPSLPYQRIHEFVADLRNRTAMAARALEFAIFTATRTTEGLKAEWSEFDFDNAVWTIPPERMKAGVEHQVPLSPTALELLLTLPRIQGEKHVFITPSGGPMSNMAMIALIKRMHEAHLGQGGPGYTDPKQRSKVITTHGFRSSFRVWAAERGKFPDPVLEICLAHQQSSEVVAAYARTDLLEIRAQIMREWCLFCTTPFSVTRPTWLESAPVITS